VAAFAGTELAVTRTGAEVGAGAFDVVGAEVLVFGTAVGVVGTGGVVVGAADVGVRTGVAGLEAVVAGAKGMGGANELGAARGIGGASGLAVVTGAAADEVVSLDVATGAVANGLADDDGFAPTGEVMTTVAIGA
jgi:hypothetical protein